MNTSINQPRPIVGYDTWINRRARPAYVRGIPFWVWEAALRTSTRPSRTSTPL
jgi:hypothetical protein